ITLVFTKKPRLLFFGFYATCKGEGSISHSHEKITLNPLSSYLFYMHRHTRSNAQGPLHQLTNEELARLERQNRQQPRTTDTNMGDHGNMDDLTAALALIQQQMQNQQQQMQQMQQTIQNQQQAAQEQAAENAAREERDDIAAKMDQLLKGNQSQVFIMEEATPEKNAGDKAFEAEQAGDDQQEVSYVNGQGWQLKNYHPNPNVRNNPQLFWPKQDKQVDPAQNNQGQYSGYQKNYQPRTYVLSQPQSNQPQIQNHQNTQVATSTPVAVPQDETKTMLQQLLQGQQLQGKALNQHKELEQPPADQADEGNTEPVVETVSPGSEQPSEAVRPIPEAVPPREYIPKVPYPVPAKVTLRAEAEQSMVNIDADGYAKMLDSARSMGRMVASLSLGEDISRGGYRFLNLTLVFTKKPRLLFFGFYATCKGEGSISHSHEKMDQLLKGNQSQVFIMEEATPEKNAGDKAFEAEQAGDDQQEVSYVNGQGWQLKNYHPNLNVRNNPQLFWPKQDKQVDPAQNNQGQYSGYQKNYQPRTYVLSQPQSNQPQIQNHQNTQVATSTPVAVPQDETKTMLQQLLQGQQLQGKALNQVTTEINTRMNHMFGDLSTKYDNVASHMRQMDIQIAQTAESVKRQKGTLPGKTDKNPKECNAVQLRSGKQLSEPERRRFTAAEKGKQKELEQPPADQADEGNTEPVVETVSPGSEQPSEAVRPIPEAVPPREYIPKVPYPVPAKVTRVWGEW
ncbi:hypothetical protein IGI04_024945, partial [Brassica rapa subsp. trilocularis]